MVSAAPNNGASPTSQAPLLEVQGLGFSYARKAVLQAMDVIVAPGEAVCILGENGAGKSTLLKLCAGLLPPSSGRVRIDGSELAGQNRAAIGKILVFNKRKGP